MKVTSLSPTLASRDEVGTDSRSTRKMRVAYLMSRFPKITETFILREMIELQRQGYDVEVFPLRREKTNLIQPDAKPFVDRANFTPLISWSIVWANLVSLGLHPLRYLGTLAILIRANVGCLRYLFGALLYFPKAVFFARRLKQIGVDHVHAHFASHPAAVAFAIGRLSGIPYSFVAHGSDLHRDQHMLQEKTQDAAFVVAISQYNRRMILDVCGQEFADKVHVVHCGIDPIRFARRDAQTLFDSGHAPFCIVCVGTLHEVKGQSYLIEACRMLAERGIDFSCHFLGGGDDLQKLQQQADSSQLGSRIRFHGSCTSDDVVKQLQLADVLVAPSVLSSDGRREGIPVVLMEAMACGIPCVASRLSGIPELVEDNVTGILTPPGDANSIADALERLANDSLLRKVFADASVAKVKDQFCLAKNTDKLARLLLLEGENKGTGR